MRPLRGWSSWAHFHLALSPSRAWPSRFHAAIWQWADGWRDASPAPGPLGSSRPIWQWADGWRDASPAPGPLSSAQPQGSGPMAGGTHLPRLALSVPSRSMAGRWLAGRLSRAWPSRSLAAARQRADGWRDALPTPGPLGPPGRKAAGQWPAGPLFFVLACLGQLTKQVLASIAH